MTTPTPDELAQQRHELANAMLTMTEQITPIFDTADGMRADLEKRGWSPTAAEQVALAWLMGAVRMVMRVQQ
ncbi:hypothetical protein AB0N20_27415 [Streptomyces griseoincarnatus]